MATEKSPDLTHVDSWVFDLDNTLYPHHINLWEQVDERIRDYIANFLKVTKEEAFRLQKDYYKRYGTSMRGLMTEHGMKPDDFLDFVHQVDHSPLQPNPALGVAIETLPGRKLILTNGTRRHADAVLARLGLERHFDDVFDIVAAGHLEFYDYEAKYLDAGSREVIPALLPDALAARIRELAIAAFKAIDGAGMARVDFLLAGDSGALYLNELNTIPGFTTISMYSKMWAASGLPYPQLLDRLIALAIERHAEKQQLRTSM